MKTFLPILALLIFSFAAAQEPSEVLVIEKGTWNLPGNVALSFQNDENGFDQQENSSESSSNLFILAPSFGYAIKNNLVIGAGLNYSHQKIENSTTGVDSNNRSTFTNQFVDMTVYNLLRRNFLSEIPRTFAIFRSTQENGIPYAKTINRL